MSSNQEHDLFHLGTRIVADKINHKRNEDLVALGNNKDAFDATVKLRALEAYQSSLEQELAANQQLLEYAQKSDAELDQLVPGWRESRDQYARSAKAVAEGFSTAGEIIEPGLLDLVGPTAKAAKLAGIFITLEKAGKLVPDSVFKVASKLDNLLSGKAPSAELAPFEKAVESKLTQDIRVANQALASKNTPDALANAPKGPGRELSPVFKDVDTGLNAINPIVSINRGRIKELGFDPDKGKLALHEGQAAVQLENTLGGTLKRVDPPTTPGQKNPDFMFVDGPYAGKTVDFMWTDGTRSVQINKFFSNNAAQNQKQLIDHIGKADIVPLDYRNLNAANQDMVNSWIKNLTSEQRGKIIILR